MGYDQSKVGWRQAVWPREDTATSATIDHGIEIVELFQINRDNIRKVMTGGHRKKEEWKDREIEE